MFPKEAISKLYPGMWSVETQLCYCPQLSLMRARVVHWWGAVGQRCLRTADPETGIVRVVFVSCKLNANLGCQHVS